MENSNNEDLKHIPIFMANNFPINNMQLDERYDIYLFPQELVVLLVVN